MYVIAHKKFSQRIPQNYLKLLVGADGKKGDFEGFLKDNVGDNISSKNANYCELTGLYWLWKNSRDKNIGISHYRRYFTSETENQIKKDFKENRCPKIITVAELDQYLQGGDWIVSKQYKFKYYHLLKMTLYKQYVDNHPKEGLMLAREIISQKYPEYLADFDKVIMKGNAFTPYNMMYTSKRQFDKYCEWLFGILFEIEKKLDISNYDKYQARVFGFISERLLEVYLTHNQFKLVRLNVINTEQDPYSSNSGYINSILKRLNLK
jgi:hypothetical protein